MGFRVRVQGSGRGKVKGRSRCKVRVRVKKYNFFKMGKTIVCFLVIELIQREKRNDDSKEERIDGRLTLSD